MAQDSSSTPAGSSALQVIVYWAIVAVPLGWGVYKTVQKSIPLFGGATATATAPASAASPATMIVPAPEASPFSTAQPSATAAPIVTPVPPAT